jgi:hypothetical protein
LLDPTRFQQDALRTPAQLTDVYLLGLAASRGGMLATLDRSIHVDGVVDGAKSLQLL